MTNSIFVSREDTFELTVYYAKEGDFAVKRPDDLTDEERESGGYLSLTIKFGIPDHATSKALMRRSTTYVGGTAGFDAATFNNLLFETLAKSWDVKDDNGKPLDFDIMKLNDMRPDIVRAFVDLLQEKLEELGLYIAVLQS